MTPTGKYLFVDFEGRTLRLPVRPGADSGKLMLLIPLRRPVCYRNRKFPEDFWFTATVLSGRYGHI